MQAKDHWKDTLVQSLQMVIDHVNGTAPLDTEALTGLIHSLPIQISFWKQDMTRAEKKEVFELLAELLSQDKWIEQLREGLPFVLAILAISVNDYPDLAIDEEFVQWEHKHGAYSSLMAIHREVADKWQQDSSHYSSGRPGQHDTADQAGRRAQRAQRAARIYTLYPSLRKEHSNSLLLLGLAGLLGSLTKLSLEPERILPV
ncbi:hypothetical protein FRC12_007217 [Ceratobasidium sp. 428]|nr:hypothetical protein FRC12_007217 [Ceratobasidium sp. 428]